MREMEYDGMKIKHLIYNISVCLLYLVGVLILEAFCAAKLIMDQEWCFGYDMIIILIMACVLVPHYMLLRFLSTYNGLITHTLLGAFDLVLTSVVLLFLFFPNNVIGEPVVKTHLFIFVIHIVLLSTRILSYRIMFRNIAKQ